MDLTDLGTFSRSLSSHKYFLNNYKASETLFPRSSDSFFFLYWFFFNKYIYWGHLKETILLFQICSCISLWVYLMVTWKKLYHGGLFLFVWWFFLRSSIKKLVVIPGLGRKNWIIAFFPFQTIVWIYSVQTMNTIAIICTIWSLCS